VPVGSELNGGLGRSETCVCSYLTGGFVLAEETVEQGSSWMSGKAPYFESRSLFLKIGQAPPKKNAPPRIPKNHLVPVGPKSTIPESGEDPIGSKKTAMTRRRLPIPNKLHIAIVACCWFELVISVEPMALYTWARPNERS